MEILEEELVPETYEITKVVEMPVLKNVTTPEYIPVKQITNFTMKVPVIVEKWEIIKVPYIDMVDKIVEEPRNVTSEVIEDQETEIKVEKTYEVPVTE